MCGLVSSTFKLPVLDCLSPITPRTESMARADVARLYQRAHQAHLDAEELCRQIVSLNKAKAYYDEQVRERLQRTPKNVLPAKGTSLDKAFEEVCRLAGLAGVELRGVAPMALSEHLAGEVLRREKAGQEAKATAESLLVKAIVTGHRERENAPC